MTPRERVEFLIIGAGIAGASVAYWLARQARVAVLEREPHPGYHSTGRSAAMFMETYGPAQVRTLTRASRSFFESPPPGFTDHALLSPRGSLFVATHEQKHQLDQYWDEIRAENSDVQLLDGRATCAMLPVLRKELMLGAVHEAAARDIDVHAVHQGYLRGLRQRGGTVHCDSEVIGIERTGGRWLVRTPAAEFEADVILNAAGAWADRVASLASVRPIGLEPRRRSAFTFAPPEGVDVRGWPAVIGAEEDWYFKPDAGLLLGSPANADPTHPQDVQAEELDVAIAVERIETVSTLSIRRPIRIWAGLRSFVSDGCLVGGFDAEAPGFFWVAAQGGYGIQTSAAMGEACAALARDEPIPQHLQEFGLSAAALSPARLR